MILAGTLSLYGYGTSEGVTKGWDTRGRGRKQQIAWKPVMSLAEAKEWNKNSMIKGVHYHGTSTQKARGIYKNGFNLPRPSYEKRVRLLGIPGSFGRIVGIYGTPYKEYAKMYAGDEEDKNPQILKVMFNVKKMYDLDSTNRVVTAAWLRSKGYDGFFNDDEVGILDKKNIVVVK
jgi:hypothetical protein